MEDVPELKYSAAQKPLAGPIASLFVGAVGVAALAARLPGWYVGAVFALDLACLYTLTWHRGYELQIADGILTWRANLRGRRVPLASICRVRPARWPGTLKVVELTGARPMVVSLGPNFPRFAEELRALLPGVPVIVAEPSWGTIRMRERRQRSWERLPIPRLLLTTRVLLAVESCVWFGLEIWLGVRGIPEFTAVFAIGSTFGLTSAMGLGWWSRRGQNHAPDWRRLAVVYARFCAAALAFVGLALGVVDLIQWTTGITVASWQATIPANTFLVAANALIIPGLVFSRRRHPLSSGGLRQAAGSSAP